MPFRVDRFGGLSSRAAPYQIPDHKAQDLRNVSTRDGVLEKRVGSERLNATAVSGAVLSIFEYDTAAAAYRRVVKHGSTWSKVNAGFTGFDTLKSSATNSTLPARSAQIRDLLLIADYDEAFVMSGATFDAMTHAAPTAPTVVAGTGSLPNGTYLYKTVPYSSVISQEGPASALTTYTVTATTAPNVTPTYTADTIWDQVRVYRTVVGGSTYLFHSTRSTPFSAFNDTTADASLGSALSSTTRVQIADAADVAIRNDRSFLIRKNDPLLYYSIAGKPNEFESAGTLNALDRTDKPVALATTVNSMYVLGEHAIYMLAGDRPANYSLARIAGSVGCMSRPTVKTFEDVVYFLGRGAVYAFDGVNPPRDISTEDVRDEIAGFVSSRLGTCVAEINPRDREYILAFTPTGSVNSEVLRFKIPAPGSNETGEWFHDDRYVSALGHIRDSGDDFKIYHGDDVGFLYKQEVSHYFDGVDLSASTNSGTATSGSTTTLVDSGATFATTGSGLIGLVVEVTYSNGTRANARITANTSTQLTFAALSTAVSSGVTYQVAPIRAYWTSKRFGAGTFSRFKEWSAFFEEQTHSEKLRVGFNVDNETTFTYQTVSMNAEVHGRGWVGRYGHKCTFRVELGGANRNFQLANIVVEVEQQEAD